LSIARFQSAEVSFQPVGIVWDMGIREVVEHVRQGIMQEASGPLDIGEDPASCGTAGDGGSKALLPFLPTGDKTVTLLNRGYMGNLLKKPTQVLDCCPVGIAPTPGQSLSLNMHEATLNGNPRPDSLKKRLYLLETVDCDAGGQKRSFRHQSCIRGSPSLSPYRPSTRRRHTGSAMPTTAVFRPRR